MDDPQCADFKMLQQARFWRRAIAPRPIRQAARSGKLVGSGTTVGVARKSCGPFVVVAKYHPTTRPPLLIPEANVPQ